MTPVYCALVHHPVRNRFGEEVTTSVTNLDVHDLARAARTYGLARCFFVTPIEAQRRLVEGIAAHWLRGPGLARIPERAEALRLATTVASIEEALERIEQECGRKSWTVATAARSPAALSRVSYAETRRRIAQRAEPLLLLFGTGHGLHERVFSLSDAVLPPIVGPSDYNHLSVRAAVAITLDRLLGEHSGDT